MPTGVSYLLRATAARAGNPRLGAEPWCQYNQRPSIQAMPRRSVPQPIRPANNPRLPLFNVVVLSSMVHCKCVVVSHENTRGSYVTQTTKGLLREQECHNADLSVVFSPMNCVRFIVAGREVLSPTPVFILVCKKKAHAAYHCRRVRGHTRNCEALEAKPGGVSKAASPTAIPTTIGTLHRFDEVTPRSNCVSNLRQS